ncbi:MAG: protein kinase domain-containing protein [Endozoicomonas sp.]|uniref:protein kinase domain-containing protein n=1 Tax=Endozoicomonas sp. TaxID=1892382 RepID=UPI003D9AFEBC
MICHRVDGLSTKLFNLAARETDLVGAENDNPKADLLAGPPSNWGDWKSYWVKPVSVEKQLNLVKQLQEMETRANQFLHNRGITGKNVQVLTDDTELTKELLDAKLLELKNSHKYTYDILVDTLGTGYFDCSALDEPKMIDEMVQRWKTARAGLMEDRVKELTSAALFSFIEGHFGIPAVEEVCRRIAKYEGVQFKVPERKTVPVDKKPGVSPAPVRKQEEPELAVTPPPAAKAQTKEPTRPRKEVVKEKPVEPPVVPVSTPLVPEEIKTPAVVKQKVQDEPAVAKKASVKTVLPPEIEQELPPPIALPPKPVGQEKKPAAVAKVIEEPQKVEKTVTPPPVTHPVEVKPQAVPQAVVKEPSPPLPEKKSRQVQLKVPDIIVIKDPAVYGRRLETLKVHLRKDQVTLRMLEGRFNSLMSVLDYAHKNRTLSPEEVNQLFANFRAFVSAAKTLELTKEYVEGALSNCADIEKAFPGVRTIEFQQVLRQKLIERLRDYPRVKEAEPALMQQQFNLLLHVVREGTRSQTMGPQEANSLVREFLAWFNAVTLKGDSTEFLENVLKDLGEASRDVPGLDTQRFQQVIREKRLRELRNYPAVTEKDLPVIEKRFKLLMSVVRDGLRNQTMRAGEANGLMQTCMGWLGTVDMTGKSSGFIENALQELDKASREFRDLDIQPFQQVLRDSRLRALHNYPRVQKVRFSELEGQFRLLMSVIQEGYQNQTLQTPQVQQYVNEFHGWLNHVEVQGMSAEFAENVKLSCEFIDGAFKGAGSDRIRQLIDIRREEIVRAWENDKGQVITHGKVLGAGNFGEARLIESGRETRAMKVALDGPGKNFQGEMINLEKERQIIARMDHPHIVKEVGKKPVESKVKLVKEHEQDDFIMMDEVSETVAGLQLELADGSLDLKSKIWRQMPLGQRFLACHQLMRGMRHMHRKGYAHLDLKPDNLLYSHKEGVKVSDFGLSEELRTVNGRNNRIPNIGVLSYSTRAAPERQKEDYSDGTKCDSWSLGIAIAELLTGENPMHQPNIVQEFLVLSNGFRAKGHAGTLLRQTLENDIWTFLNDRQHLLGPATNMLWDMLQPDPYKRLSVEDAFAKHGASLEQTSWNPPVNDTRVLP